MPEGNVGDSARSDWLEDELAAREHHEPTAGAPSDKLVMTGVDFEELESCTESELAALATDPEFSALLELAAAR